MARLQDKVVIISGGARGQDAAEARLLVSEWQPRDVPAP